MYIDGFSEKIKLLRMRDNLTQKELANILDVQKSMISAYKNSTRFPGHQTLIRIALYFKVSTDYLYGIEDRKTLDVTGAPDGAIEIASSLIKYARSMSK